MERELKKTFVAFASFGNRSTIQDDYVQMDSRALQKLCKDSGLTHPKRLTTTDIDLLFASVKSKGERKIDFSMFLQLTQMFAVKLNRAHAEVVVQIAAANPRANTSEARPSSSYGKKHHNEPASYYRPASSEASRTETPRAMPRLHPDWYEVRNPNATSEKDQFYYVNRKTNETSWKMPLLVPSGKLQVPPPPSPNSARSESEDQLKSKLYPSLSATSPVTPPLSPNSPSDKELARSAGRRRASLRNLEASFGKVALDSDTRYVSESKESSGGNIFDRLTDPRLYTGAHKHRFDPRTGKGRGLQGRDSVAKGPGYSKAASTSFKGYTNTGSEETFHSISQILRPSF